MKEKNKLKQYLFSLLAKREYSEWELKDKLSHKVQDPEFISLLLNEFKLNGWQSDDRFVSNLIESKKNRYGLLKIKQDLKNKGIEITKFESYFPQSNEEIEIAKKILQKKYKILENSYSCKQKYFRFLYTKGFSSEVIYAAIEKSISDSVSDP